MRSMPLLAATTVILAAAWSCGGGGTDVNVPVANFTVGACTAGAACQFTNTSTPATGLTYSWDFGDGTAKVADQSPAHTFATAGTYTVALTVTDASHATNTKSTAVTVAAGTNQPPVASFDLPTSACVAGTPCGFHNTSSDPDGTIASSSWDFGDGTAPTTTPDATHTYAAAGTYTVVLTVTDDKGGTNAASQPITVSPPASQDCTTSTTVVDCALGLTQKVTVTFTIVSSSCELAGNKLTVTPPALPEQTAFFNLCNRTAGETYTVNDGTPAAAPLAFQPGTTLAFRFHQGPQGTNPPVSDPGIRITGRYPTWTLNIDDGGAAGTPGEPDFNDVVMTVQATRVP